MTKVWFGEHEFFPFMTMTETGDNSGVDVTISEEELTDYKQVMRRFYDWQTKVGQLWDSVGVEPGSLRNQHE